MNVISSWNYFSEIKATDSLGKKALLIEEAHWETLNYTGILAQCMDLTADITASIFSLIPIKMSENERNSMDVNLAMLHSARLNRSLGPGSIKFCDVPLYRTAVVDGWNPLAADLISATQPEIVLENETESDATQSSQVQT